MYPLFPLLKSPATSLLLADVGLGAQAEVSVGVEVCIAIFYSWRASDQGHTLPSLFPFLWGDWSWGRHALG